MKYRFIRLEFPEDLTEHQKKVLEANLNGLKESAEREVSGLSGKVKASWLKKKLSWMPGVGQVDQYLDLVTGYVGSKMAWFVFFEFPDTRTAVFYYSKDKTALVNLGQRGFVNLIQEGKAVEGLKKFVFPDMGIDPSLVRIDVGDVELEKKSN